MSRSTLSPVVPADLDIGAVQAALAADGIDGWLLYDFRGSNSIAATVAGVNRRGGHLATRRWYYLIPATGTPRGLVHAIERHTLAHLPGTTAQYTGRTSLEAGLRRLLTGVRRVAMEYSPRCAIPYLARVDAGTVELVRDAGADVVSSGDLVQRFAASWSAATVRTHLDAAVRLYRVKDRAFDAIADRVRRGGTTEYEIQQLMIGWFADEGLVTDAEPNVSVAANTGDPHYQPTADVHRTIGTDELVLLDLWAKLDVPGAVFADITWMGYTGSRVPDRYTRAFEAVAAARDAAVALVERAVSTGQTLQGWQVDRAAAQVLERAGYADHILHRTGHSLGAAAVHGDGVNMDDYETHDERRLLPGAGFTIEPGVYLEDFGVRTEINMIISVDRATVTGDVQSAIRVLG